MRKLMFKSMTIRMIPTGSHDIEIPFDTDPLSVLLHESRIEGLEVTRLSRLQCLCKTCWDLHHVTRRFSPTVVVVLVKVHGRWYLDACILSIENSKFADLRDRVDPDFLQGKCLEESPDTWFTKIDDSVLTIRSAAVLMRRIKAQTSGTPGSCPAHCVGSSFLLLLRQTMSDHHPMLL